jgi:C-terminal processing protease CtpA/Prc
VFVLTDGTTASAAEPLADVLQATGRATIVGATTAGAVLTSEYLDLPGGWRLQLPTGTYVNAAGVELEGRGVVPDVAVPSATALDYVLSLPDSPAVGG